MHTIARVLLAGGAEPSLTSLQQVLESAGHAATQAASLDEVVHRIGAGEAEVVVLSSKLLSALETLAEAQCGRSPVSVVIYGNGISGIEARAALRAGASEVVDHAAGEHTALVAVERAAREAQLRRELAMLRARVGEVAQRSLIGRSASMSRVRELIGRAAASRTPVVVTGEAGTGKDVVARLVHDLSDRATRPLVTVRCAGTAPDALERELFGRASGNGARASAGLLEEARGGTIVLDDAHALSPALRAQLARAGATRQVRRLGGNEAIPADVRLILTARAAGDADTASIDDLLTRFNALLIDLPPLRDRRSDVPQLVQHFRQRFAAEQGLDLPPLAPEAMLPLLGHEWTGNVRELEHWVERSALAARVEQPHGATGPLPGVDLGTSEVTLEQLERAYILHVLKLEAGHQSRTAVRLGIDRRTLYRKLKQYRGEGHAIR